MHNSLQQNASQLASKLFQRSDGRAEGLPQVCRNMNMTQNMTLIAKPSTCDHQTCPAFSAKEGDDGFSLISGSSKCNISARTLKHLQETTWDFIQLIKDISGAVTQVTISRGICGLPKEMRIYHQTLN